MKKQLLLTCAVVAMAAGKAQAGDYVEVPELTDIAPAKYTSTGNERSSSNGFSASSWTSDGSGAPNFEKTHNVPATQTVTKTFRWVRTNPQVPEPVPDARVTRTANFDAYLSASAGGSSGTASAKVVFSLSEASDKPFEATLGPGISQSDVSLPSTPMTKTVTRSPVIVNGVPTIVVETTIGVVSSMKATGTWTGPPNPAPYAMGTSGDNHIAIASIECFKIEGVTAALPSAPRFAYARTR